MKKLLVATVALVSAASFAQAAQTTYAPHPAAGTSRVAFQEVATNCSGDREIQACVVSLGPMPSDHWAYFLEDSTGERSDHVQFKSREVGAPCSAMAYPVGHVSVMGNTGDWFTGRIQNACRP